MVWKRFGVKKNRNVEINMKVDIPYYNYTKKQLDELEEIVNQFTWEFDTTETRKQLNSIIRDKVNEYIRENRDSKINQIIDATSSIQTNRE